MNEGWKYAAASVIGTSHQTSPEGVCQDAHAFRYLEDFDVFVGVVSDGAGSASHSQTGSRRTCDFIIERISRAVLDAILSEHFAIEALKSLRVDLQTTADELGLELRSLACTMLVAIVTPSKAAFWQIGDGAICFRPEGEQAFGYVFWPEKGEYANITSFVTDLNALDHLDFDVVEARIADLAMFSDGLERLALDFTTGEAHSGFFKALFPHIRALPEGYSESMSSQIGSFLESERVNKRTDDDKTLMLASRSI